MQKIALLLTLLIPVSSNLLAFDSNYDPMSARFNQADVEPSLRINNRPLVRVAGKVITLLDVVKNLDMKMRETHPELLDSPVGRYQFYSAHWRSALEAKVENALMLKEAEELKLQISDPQIYEEIESRFGPNVIQNLDIAGLSYEEAKEMIYEEIVLSSMQWYRIYQKAYQSVTPKALHFAYDDYLQKNKPKETYTYHVVSVKNPELNEDMYQTLAKQIAPFLEKETIDNIDNIVPILTKQLGEQADVQVSREYCLQADQMSKQHLSVLSNLLNHTCSSPVIQTNRKDHSPVMRVFYLVDHHKQQQPRFEDLSERLHDQILSTHIEKYRKEYITKLKKRYGCDRADFYDMIPDNFQPFVLE